MIVFDSIWPDIGKFDLVRFQWKSEVLWKLIEVFISFVFTFWFWERSFYFLVFCLCYIFITESHTAKWFQVLQLFIIPSRFRLATMWSVLLSMLSILYDLCRDFVDPWALDCLSIPIDVLVLDGERIASNLVRGSLNVPPGLFLKVLFHFFGRIVVSVELGCA